MADEVEQEQLKFQTEMNALIKKLVAAIDTPYLIRQMKVDLFADYIKKERKAVITLFVDSGFDSELFYANLEDTKHEVRICVNPEHCCRLCPIQNEPHNNIHVAEKDTEVESKEETKPDV